MKSIKEWLKDFLVDWLFEEKFLSTDGISLNRLLYRKILPRIEEYNNTKLPLRNLLCENHDEDCVRFLASGLYAKKIVWGRKQKDAAKYGLGMGYTFEWLMNEQASSENILRVVEQTILRDQALQKALIFDACLKTSTYGFFNGGFNSLEKRDRPPSFKDLKFNPDHSHYIALDKDKFIPTALAVGKRHIREHLVKQEKFVCFLNSDMGKEMYKAKLFNKLDGKKRKNNEEIFTFPSETIIFPKYIGKSPDGKIIFFEDEWIPDNYILLLALTKDKILRFIEKRNPYARGLFLNSGHFSKKTPLINSDFLHWCSVFVLRREAGVVFYLGKKWKDPEVIANIVA